MSKLSIQLAKPLKPSEKAYKDLGFVLESSDNYELLNATLPEGWTFNENSDWIATSYILYDEKKRARVYSIDVAHSRRHVLSNKTTMYPRYSLEAIDRKDDHPKGRYEIVVRKSIPVDDTTKGKFNYEYIFSGGRCEYDCICNYTTGQYRTKYRAVQVCVDFLQIKFPDWQNPEAYWD